jgi:nicotinamide-nucleotide amidase
MAEGARKRTGADYAISVTGIAGPTGGSEEKPVGCVFIGVSGPEKTVAEKFQFFGTRDAIRERSRVVALDRLRLLMMGKPSVA